MPSLEEFKELIRTEIAPFNAKIAHFQTTLNELENSVKFLSAKYDKLVTHSQSSNEKQRKIGANLEAFKKNLISVEEELDDFAQYLRRDCVEISGISATENLSCEDIVTSLARKWVWNSRTQISASLTLCQHLVMSRMIKLLLSSPDARQGTNSIVNENP